MPEGHTIHRLARELARDLGGHVVAAETRQDRFADGAQRIDGRVLEDTSAWGKHLFLHWAASHDHGAEILHVHLGLFGTFVRRTLPAPEPSDALRVRLTGPERAWDLTGAIICDLREPGADAEVAAKLGPDPLRRDADPQRFVDRVLRSRKSIGALLLDQTVIAGIGNVYRAELLHLHGIHPDREGRLLDEAEVQALWASAVEHLRLGVKRNRIVTVPLAGRSASAIPRDEAVHVYRQERCLSCGSAVERTDVGGRNSFACPSCQPR
ncbi:MAG: Fpg/Nei family DNA glycosylase [Acidimicrobiales bacterium]